MKPNAGEYYCHFEFGIRISFKKSCDRFPFKFKWNFTKFMVISLCSINYYYIHYQSCFFRKKTHMVTKNTITELKRNKKYIPNLFIELNEGREHGTYAYDS